MKFEHYKREEIGKTEIKFLFKKILPVAQKAFGRYDDKFKDDVLKRLFSSQNILLVKEGDKIIAFRFWDYFNFDLYDTIIYLAGLAVLPEKQGIGIGRKTIEYVLQDDLKRTICSKDQICPLPKAKYVVMRTQNFHMAKLFFNFAKKEGGSVYPFDGCVSPEIAKVVSVVATNIGDSCLGHENLISRCCYGETLYGKDISNNNWNEIGININISRGDAVYCLWKR